MSLLSGIKNSQTYSEQFNLDPADTIVLDHRGDEFLGDDFGLDGSSHELSDLESNDSMTVVDLLAQLETFLEGLNPEQQSQYKAQIESLKSEISSLRSNSLVPSHLVESFYSIQSELMGGEEMGLDGMDGTISQQVEALKAQVENNEKLDDQTRELLLGKLEDVANIESIDAETAQEKLDGLSEEIENYTNYSSAAMRLDQELGFGDPATVQEMLDRHGIDGDAAAIDPEKLEALMNDSVIADAVANEQDAHQTAYKTMMDMVPAQIKAAHEINTMTDQKDSSMAIDTDITPFQWLHETQTGDSKEAKKTLETANALAEKKASILSALTNTEVKVDPNEPGVVSLPSGGSFNAVNNTSSSGPALVWPEIEAIPFHADVEGDGQTAFPDWMKESHYPYETTDTGGWNPLMLLTGIIAGPGLLNPGAAAVVGGAGGELTAYTPDDPY